MSKRAFTHVVLLSNFEKEEEKQFIDWLRKITPSTILKYHTELTSPTEFREIYEASVSAINDVKKKIGQKEMLLTYHLSPGTPAMAAIWILLSKTSHPAEILESSPEQSVKTVSLPFNISADYVPDILRPADDEIFKLTQGRHPHAKVILRRQMAGQFFWMKSENFPCMHR